jgi:hypothetical protein
LKTYSFQASILNMPTDGNPGDSDSLRALVCGTLMIEVRVGTSEHIGYFLFKGAE